MFSFIGKCVVYGLAAYGAVKFSSYATKRGSEGVKEDLKLKWNEFQSWLTETDQTQDEIKEPIKNAN